MPSSNGVIAPLVIVIVNWPSTLLSNKTVTEFASGLLVIESTEPPRIVYCKKPVSDSRSDGVVIISGAD